MGEIRRPPLVTPTMKPLDIITVKLTEAHNDFPIYEGPCDRIIILDADQPFQIKLNDPQGAPIDVPVIEFPTGSMKIETSELAPFTSVLVTNVAYSEGTAKIMIGREATIITVTPGTKALLTHPNDYGVAEIDLSEARADEALNINGLGLHILTVPNAFSYKMNATTKPALDAKEGDGWAFEFSNIYVTNAATTGIGKILYWRRA